MTTAPTVASLLRARRHDQHPGYVFDDRVYTWAEVVQQSIERAAVLDELLPAASPRHVGVLLDNEPEYLFLAGGAALVGATVVGINPTRRGGELAADIAHTDCRVVITDAAGAQLLHEAHLAVPVVVTLGRVFGFLVAQHQGLHHLAQGVLVQRHVAGQEPGQPRQHQRLHGHLGVAVGRGGLLALAAAALQQVVEQAVEIAAEVAARRGRPLQHGLAVHQEALVEVTLQPVLGFQVAAHRQKPSARSSCSNQSKPMGLTMRLLITTMRASLSGSALKCWCAQYGGM